MELITKRRPEVRMTHSAGGSTVLERDSQTRELSNFSAMLMSIAVVLVMTGVAAVLIIPWLAIATVIPSAIAAKYLIGHMRSKEPRSLLVHNRQQLTWQNSPVREKDYLNNFIYNEALQDLFDQVFVDDKPLSDSDEVIKAWYKTFQDLNKKMEDIVKKEKELKAAEIPNYLEKFKTYEDLLKGLDKL